MAKRYYDFSDTWEIFERMREILGDEELLDSLAKAMSTDDLLENLEYIDRMEETGVFAEYDDEYDDEE